MKVGYHRERGSWVAVVRVWLICLVCGLSGSVFSRTMLAQTGTDGAIGGQLLSASGTPVVGALVEVREIETGLTERVLSGATGEFLLVRLPMGEYAVTVELAGVVQTLPGLVAVGLGEVTEVSAHLGQHGAGLQKVSPDASGRTTRLTEADIATLPVDGGEWRSLAATVAGGNGSAEEDGDAGDASFRGVGVAQNSTRIDGAIGDESFTGARVGAGVEEETETGADDVSDRTSGVGSGSRAVADGGRRTGSSYAFSQTAVREFRVQGQGNAAAYGSALYGHGVGGVVTAVSRSGSATLHGMVFYTVRDSAWAATNPFSVVSNYVDGAVTNAIVKPPDLRQQYGGRLGGPCWCLGGGSSSANLLLLRV